MATYGELVQWARKELEILGPEESQVSSERLLMALTGQDRTHLYLLLQTKADQETVSRFETLIRKRKNRVPVAYLVGKAGFWEETLSIEEGCFIPRPETETLIKSFIRHSGFEKTRSFSFLDLCAGSGAIGIALLRHYPESSAVFSDISERALMTVTKNLKAYGLQARGRAVRSDLFSAFKEGRWDAIFCNPPYFSESDWAGLEPEIFFEPCEALDGGKDGLDFYRRILTESPSYLAKGGWLVLETGIDQAETVSKEARGRYFGKIAIFKDDLGIERAVMACSG